MNRNYQLFEITRSYSYPQIIRVGQVSSCACKNRARFGKFARRIIVKRASSIFHFSFVIVREKSQLRRSFFNLSIEKITWVFFNYVVFFKKEKLRGAEFIRLFN